MLRLVLPELLWDVGLYDCNYCYGDGYYGYRPDRYKEKYRSEGSGGTGGGGPVKEPGASSTYRPRSLITRPETAA